MSRPLADLVMRAAQTLAPPERADWSSAMRGEFDAIEGGGRALAWAGGCLATAAGWRLRANLFYVAIVAVLIGVDWQRLADPLIMNNGLHGMAWAERAALISNLCVALPALVLAFLWPRRAWISTLIVLATNPQTPGAFSFFWNAFSRHYPAAMNHPHLPGWILSFYMLGQELFFPLIGGAVLGHILGRLAPTARTATF